MTTLAAMDGLDWLRHGPWLLFTFCFGASVGSFINVVVYRMPRGVSLMNPPSQCPGCGGQLRFFRENLPVLGWLLLKGRCKWCACRISPVYPIVECLMGLLFVGLYAVFFMSVDREGWWWQVAGPWWGKQGFALAWPAYTTFAVLLAALWAITVIDAKTFLIPIQIPVFATITAFVLWPLQGLIARNLGRLWPVPGADWSLVLAGLLGMVGVIVSCLLLWRSWITPSFADYDDYIEDGEVLGDYPHARREVLRELLFLLPCIVGIAAGWWLGAQCDGAPGRWLQALGGAMFGYLVGGGLVWAVRILGTLGFGREAMGLGDVHLLAAVGAVTGWLVPLIAFFIAPFMGLAWAGVAALWGHFGGKRHELPYGPHLALATVLVVLGWPAVLDGWDLLLPTVEPPQRRLVEPAAAGERVGAIHAHWMHAGRSGGHWTMNTFQYMQLEMEIERRHDCQVGDLTRWH